MGKGSDTSSWLVTHKWVYDGTVIAADSGSDHGWTWHTYNGLNRVAEATDSAGRARVRYVLTDHQGTVQALLSDTGAVLGHWIWDPWGNIEESWTQRTTDLLYQGKPYETALGQWYWNRRWYSPERGEYTGRDPKLQYWTPYNFVGNAPVIGIDPDGMENTVYLYNESQRDISIPALSSLIRNELIESGAPQDLQVKEIGFFHKTFLSLDKTDVLLHLSDIGVGDKNVLPTGGLGGDGSANVWVDNLMNAQKSIMGGKYSDINGFMQVLKTSIHEIGHAEYGFKDNVGGVMNQGAYQSPKIGWHYTDDERNVIKAFYATH
jgi:RHS repeat-associated protein